MMVFGPVLSKRLGHSVGINNIRANKCSYACVYCHVDRKTHKSLRRDFHYKPEDIFSELQSLLIKVKARNKPLDYFTFIPCGESTLDINLGDTIDLIRLLGPKIAVITNGSLLTDDRVRQDLVKADYVSLKVDNVTDPIWRKQNRPLTDHHLEEVLAGMVEFSKIFKGWLVTETMLVEDLNTREEEFQETINFLKILNPKVAYLSVPIRHPAKNWVHRPNQTTVDRCFQMMCRELNQVDYLKSCEI